MERSGHQNAGGITKCRSYDHTSEKEVLYALSSVNRVALQIMNLDTAWNSSDATNQCNDQCSEGKEIKL